MNDIIRYIDSKINTFKLLDAKSKSLLIEKTLKDIKHKTYIVISEYEKKIKMIESEMDSKVYKGKKEKARSDLASLKFKKQAELLARHIDDTVM